MINSFTVFVGLGAALGIWRVVRSAPQRQARIWANLCLIILSASLVGARLSYVWINWSHFAQYPLEVPQFWLGGLTWPGAIAGAWLVILVLGIWYRSKTDRDTVRLPIGWFTDRLYLLLPPVAIMAWLSNWQSGVGNGILLPDSAWWGIPSLDESGTYQRHFPLQLLAALALMADFWFLEMRVTPLHSPGRLSSLAFLHLLLNLFIVSLLRADPSPQWNGLRVDAWIALLYLILFLSFVLLVNLFSQAGKKRRFASPEQSSFET